MNTKRLDGTARVRRSALPLFYRGGDTGVLLLHGYTGFTGDLRYLAEKLHAEGFTVSVPRLPGHGSNGSDFLQTGWKDWLRRSIDAYLDLDAQCSSVHVGGLSMGGLLAMILASFHHPRSLALYAPAVFNTDRRILLTPFLRYFIRQTDKVADKVAENEDEEHLLREYWSINWIGQAAELLSLQRMTRKVLPSVGSDTLVVVSRADGTVPTSVADYIENRSGAGRVKKIVLDRSPHVLVNGVEREEVARVSIEWFRDGF